MQSLLIPTILLDLEVSFHKGEHCVSMLYKQKAATMFRFNKFFIVEFMHVDRNN